MTLYGAPIADPLRPWETDVEPATLAHPDGIDLLNGATVLTAWWVYLTAAIAATLVAVLVVLGMRLGPLAANGYAPCGVIGRCGRRPGHRGHHGGWRT